MKRLFVYLLGFTMICTLSQCTKGDDIGDLYGRWKLVRFDCPGFSENPDSIFFGFQGQAYSYQPNYKLYDWGMYEIKNNTIKFLPMQWGGDFERIHIGECSPLFKIDLMNEDNLELSRHDSVWVLKKFL